MILILVHHGEDIIKILPNSFILKNMYIFRVLLMMWHHEGGSPFWRWQGMGTLDFLFWVSITPLGFIRVIEIKPKPPNI